MGGSWEADLEQSGNAALIAAVAVQRGLPARAATIALATAYQESDLRNLEYGDRDSLGLFQQRPSQGWGTREEILDPHYAAGAFYDALVQVDGKPRCRSPWPPRRSSARVPRRVRRPRGRRPRAGLRPDRLLPGGVLLRRGRRPGRAVSDLDDAGLTGRADAVRADLLRTFGDLPLGGFAPGGVTEGHMPGSAHYDGRAVDVFVRPVSAASKRRGWAIASYLVGQADRLGIATVIFDDRIWRVSRSSDGWLDYDVPSGSRGDRSILEHRDHVHVDVAR